jgi:hypothetical protein
MQPLGGTSNNFGATLHILTIVLCLLLSGCAVNPANLPPNLSPTPSKVEITSDLQDADCPVWIYRNRTTFHALNPDIPFVYLNELQVGKLGVASTFCLKLQPGKYQISTKESILFMPTTTSGSITIDPKKGETIYIRYGKEFAGLTPFGSTPVINSNTNLNVVNKELWETRR